MGLDQYAYTRNVGDDDTDHNEELAYWRKHNRLQGWMEELWRTKKEELLKADEEEAFLEALSPEYEQFNCVEVEIDEHDLDSLECTIEDKDFPETSGFFFGSDSYEDYESDTGYKSTDLEFIENARKALKAGKRVFYNSWW